MPRVAVGLEYDGTAYRGWQIQPEAPSIESRVARALSAVADAEVDLVCAGRTDAGVHALGQVVHFDAPARRSERSWVLGANRLLPGDIRVQWAREVPAHFHARFSALWREYCYLIFNRPIASALRRDRAAWIREPLDMDAMRVAAQCLAGEHDFASFRAAECQARSSVRHVLALQVQDSQDVLQLRVRANAFLHHMVRNLAGWLIAVGRGDRRAEDTAALLAARDRRLAAPTAPAQGLYLARVAYPDAFALPAAMDLPGP
jgi:tRNA pseudouridine38-40 synthase